MTPVLGVTDLWTYVIATVLVILLPGPNSLYVLSVASRRGVRVGYRAACGVFIGDAVLMVASAAGVASLFKAAPALYTAVKWAGAGYLAWLGFTMLRGAIRSWRSRGEPRSDDERSAARTERPFRRALIASLLNPKAILFFVAFFVQFVDPDYAYPALSFLLLGAIVQICSFCYLTALILSGSALAAAFRRHRRLSSAGTGAIGAVMIGFAARLAAASG